MIGDVEKRREKRCLVVKQGNLNSVHKVMGNAYHFLRREFEENESDADPLRKFM